MFSQILSTLLPVFLIAGCGALRYGHFRKPDMSGLNTLNMELLVPLLVFAVLADSKAALADYASLALGGAGIVLGSGLLRWPIARLLKLDLRTFLPPMMFNNTGNMGLPLVLAFGEEALPAAVVLFIVEMLLHFTIGLRLLDPATPLWRLWRIPVVLATLAGLTINLTGLHLPHWSLEAANMLGTTSVPLMLFALGVRMLDVDFSAWKIGLLGAIACPLSGLLLAWPLIQLLDLSGLQLACLWVFAALPPAVMNYMLAERYQRNPHTVASMVLIGNLGSAAVMPVVLGLLFSAGYGAPTL